VRYTVLVWKRFREHRRRECKTAAFWGFGQKAGENEIFRDRKSSQRVNSIEKIVARRKKKNENCRNIISFIRLRVVLRLIHAVVCLYWRIALDLKENDPPLPRVSEDVRYEQRRLRN